MRSMQLGMYDNMIQNVVGSYSGHVQIHNEGYWDEQTIDNAFADNDSLNQTIHGPHKLINRRKIQKIEYLKFVIKRLFIKI